MVLGMLVVMGMIGGDDDDKWGLGKGMVMRMIGGDEVGDEDDR